MAASDLIATEISTFDEFLFPVGAEDFLIKIFGHRPIFIKGPVHRFSNVLTWDALNALLAQQPLEALNIRILKEGRVVPKERFTRQINIDFMEPRHQLNARELTKLFRDGASLTLDLYREMHEPVRLLSDMLESAMFSRVHASVFASWRSTRATGIHWEPTDIIVLQIQGRKHWRLLEPSRLHPFIEDSSPSDRPPSAAYWEGDLCPGDLLHVPRGWWHDVTPYAEPTLHVTFIVKPATGVDLAELLLGKLRQRELMRANVPRHQAESEQLAYMEAFRASLSELAAGASLGALLAEYDSKLPSKGCLSLPWSAVPEVGPLPKDARLDWRPIRPPALVKSERTLRLECGSSSLDAPSSMEPILLDLIHYKSITLANLVSLHPDLDVLDFIMQLVAEGLVSVVAPVDEAAQLTT